MRVRGGMLTNREAAIIVEVIARYNAVLRGLTEAALAAAELSDDEVVSALLMASVEDAAAQMAASAAVATAAEAEHQAGAGGV